MIVVVKETTDKKIRFWDGAEWVDDKEKAKRYNVDNQHFSFGEPFPMADRGEKLGLVQIDSRAKWRALGIPSPEESLAGLCYDQELRTRTCPNVALILQDQHHVRGAVMVRREVLEQHPELLERLCREARELYGQVVVREDWPVLLEPEELAGWLRAMNPSDDDPPMPWEEAARWAISDRLDRLEWRTASGSVVVAKDSEGPMGADFVECTSLEQLLRELEGAGQDAWNDTVPVDGGGQVFDMGEAIDVRGMLFESCERELKEIGWG